MATRRRSALSLAQQALALESRFPDGTISLRPNSLTWRGGLMPTVLSRQYTVHIAHQPGQIPQVRVLDPVLDGRLGQSLPHVYREGTLCLHLAHEWTEKMFIADTIVPWSSEWLAYYEIWKATGVWEGGGVWPPTRSSDSAEPLDLEQSDDGSASASADK